MGLSLFLATLGGGPIKCSKKQWQQSDESTSGSVCFRSASSTTLKFPSHHSSKDILNILELDWDKDLKNISYTVCSTSANWDPGFTPKISSEGISCVLLPRVGSLITHNRQRICLILGSLLRFIPVRIGDCLPQCDAKWIKKPKAHTKGKFAKHIGYQYQGLIALVTLMHFLFLLLALFILDSFPLRLKL